MMPKAKKLVSILMLFVLTCLILNLPALPGETEDWGKDVIIAQVKQYVETLKRRIRITLEERIRINQEQRQYRRRVEVSMVWLN
jgi:hypothetical protein